MKKAANLRDGYDHYAPQLRILREYGVQIWGSFTLGHDFDTPETVARTLEFAQENKFAFAAFNVLMPYPNTPFYRRLAQDDRLLYNGQWWLHPEYRFNHAAFVPQSMTPAELTEAGFRARKEFNSLGSIVRRAFDFKTNMRSPYRLGLYLVYNPLFRKEVFKKHGMHFGENV
jgi:radical SAM superfamily enzyme YgiQ (UPF0313 family)